MYEWFYDPKIPFHLFGFAHILTVLIIFLLTVSLYLFRKKLDPYRRLIRLFVGWSVLICHLSLYFWYTVTDQWSLADSLPFQLCSLASLLCGIMLLTKNRFLFEILYFIGVGGAIQAIMTPDLGFGFPQYRYIQFFLLHFFIFISPLIMCWLYDYKITLHSLIKSFVVLNIIAVVVYIIDGWLSANYMFLRHKPYSASLLDVLGPYPYYILSLEGVAFVIYFILYLPFAWQRTSVKRKNQRSEG